MMNKIHALKVIITLVVGVNLGIFFTIFYLYDSKPSKYSNIKSFLTLYNTINGTKRNVLKSPNSDISLQSNTVSKISARESSARHTVSLAFFKGRLGNHIFQYAAMFGTAKRLGMNMMMPVLNDDLSRVFKGLTAKKGTLDKATSNHFKDNIDSGFDARILNLTNQKDLILEGYMQSYKYFHQYKDELRLELKFHDYLQNSAQSYLKSLIKDSKSSSSIFIGVHIRRGDMVSKFYQNYGYRVATVPYLSKAFDYFRKKFPGCIFVVCSDSKAWVRQNVKSPNMFVSDGHTEHQDLAILGNCNHTIQSVGSFGYWAAYIAGGETIYYGKPVEPGSNVAKHYRINELYPPEWKSWV